MEFFKDKIIDTLLSIDLWDVVDIILLAAAFFFVYRFAKKRRAIKLIVGVVLFLALMFLVDTAKLSALGFVFGDFKQLGLIALIIIFQPELRSALEKIGGIRVFNFHVNQMINEQNELLKNKENTEDEEMQIIGQINRLNEIKNKIAQKVDRVI